MAQTYSTELQPTQNTPADRTSALAGYDARIRRFRATIALASQASGDTIVLANVPSNYVFAGGELTSTVSLGSSTVSIGTAASAASLKAAATFTATDTPTPFGKAAAMAETAPAARQILLTIGAAALPASGTLVVDLYFSAP